MSDPVVPRELEEVQRWFGTLIARPIDANSRMMPLSPAGIPMAEEAKRYIAPSLTLEPHERIEIYNQQYWWRLLSNLHEIFPFVTRLFGYTSFNLSIGLPYLVQCPPDSWSLNPLGNRLPHWIEEAYLEPDRQLILDAARLDLACERGFVAGESPPFSEGCQDPDLLFATPVKLQQHVHLFTFDSHLLALRAALLEEEPDYWEEHDFPPLEKGHNFFFVVFRNRRHDIVWEEVPEGEFFLLSFFAEGNTLAKACEALEKESPHLLESASHHLVEWIQKWVIRGWLTKQQ